MIKHRWLYLIHTGVDSPGHHLAELRQFVDLNDDLTCDHIALQLATPRLADPGVLGPDIEPGGLDLIPLHAESIGEGQHVRNHLISLFLRCRHRIRLMLHAQLHRGFVGRDL